MSTQFQRVYELIVGDTASGEGLRLNDLQLTFDISKSSSNKDKTNSASIEVYNLSDEDLRIIDVDYPYASFIAGYRNIGAKNLFSGQVTDVSTRKSGPDRITQILMGAAYTEINHQMLSSITPPGRTVKDVAEDIRKAIPNVSRGVYNGTNLNNPILYGYPLQGTPKDMLNELSNKYAIDWQIDEDVLYIHDSDRGNTERFEDVYIISPESGLIDNAYRAQGDVRRSAKDKVKAQSVQWKTLLNGDIVAGDIVKLEDTLIQGYYKVTDLRHYGDFRGSSWYTEAKATAIDKVSVT